LRYLSKNGYEWVLGSAYFCKLITFFHKIDAKVFKISQSVIVTRPGDRNGPFLYSSQAATFTASLTTRR